MRELHVVGLSDDGRQVLLATSPDARRPGYALALDERVELALRGDLRRPGSRAESAELSIKDVQARLRAGEDPEDLAAAIGVPVSRISRYAGPVVSERNRVIEEARAAFVSRARLGRSKSPLGIAVDTAVRASGVDPADVEWFAWRAPDAAWVVRATVPSRGRSKVAEWVFDPSADELRPLDPAATALGFSTRPPPPARRRRS